MLKATVENRGDGITKHTYSSPSGEFHSMIYSIREKTFDVHYILPIRITEAYPDIDEVKTYQTLDEAFAAVMATYGFLTDRE